MDGVYLVILSLVILAGGLLKFLLQIRFLWNRGGKRK